MRRGLRREKKPLADGNGKPPAEKGKRRRRGVEKKSIAAATWKSATSRKTNGKNDPPCTSAAPRRGEELA
ncbi:hypothetical protein GWI33_013640 [Rhynchophorus ferrugineus]|uniref:Uncharacterized protein n=1 Tax=Rhynchophorus ferrugineus TaxID=354439 RepID=A0A834M7M7_RHYFE|nr:hypothetical protein GWI33_013640 [Rhynchophorus ferrugineus]